MLPKQTEYNVGIYLRLSKDDERAGESLSIENQRKILTKYVQEQGWRIYDTYIDDGISGTTFDRPGVQRMLEDAKNGTINLILCKDLSRFGRNYIQVGQYTDYIFPMYNIRFIALTDNIDTFNSDSASMDMMPIMNVFNEWHAANTSKKIRAVLSASAKSGKYLASYAAYGYIKSNDENSTPVIDEYAAGIVRRIFEMRASGMKLKAIARELNNEHILPPSDYACQRDGKPVPNDTESLWSDWSVKRILCNEIYIGNLTQLRTTTVSHKNHKVIKKDRDDWAIVEHNHEPIISMELWNKVRAIEQSHSRGKRTKKGVTLPLSGFCYCADCKNKMKQSGDPAAYICGRYARSGKQACGTHYIRAELLESIILDDIRRMIDITIDEDNARKLFLEQKSHNSQKELAAWQKQLHEKEQRQIELNRLIRSVYEDKVQNRIPEEICVKLLGEYQQELQTVETAITDMHHKIAESKQDERDVDEFIRRLKSYAGPETLTRQMCLDLIEYVTIDENPRKRKGVNRVIHIYYKLLDSNSSKNL